MATDSRRWWVQAYGDETGTTMAVGSATGARAELHLPPLHLGQKLRAAWPWVRPWLDLLIRLLPLLLGQDSGPIT